MALSVTYLIADGNSGIAILILIGWQLTACVWCGAHARTHGGAGTAVCVRLAQAAWSIGISTEAFSSVGIKLHALAFFLFRMDGYLCYEAV
jgi:hypothetical protein